MASFAGNVLPRVLRVFRERFPNVELSVHDVIQEQVVEMVESGRVEIGFGFEPEVRSELAFEALFEDHFIAVVPMDSVSKDMQALTWAQLLTHDFISLQRPSSTRRLLEESLSAHGMELKVALECHQLATVGQLVAAGLGVSVVPALCKGLMSDMGARCLRVRRPSVRKSVGLITRSDQQLSSAASAIRDVTRQQVGTPARPESASLHV
jgi:LysR family carnitine catabolism transcriptional activator